MDRKNAGDAHYMQKEITLYTDGACSGNPGPGGWGCILKWQTHEKSASGYEAETTNNRMELRAVIEGLHLLKYACSVTVYTDSSYIVNAFSRHWIDRWEKNGWMRREDAPVKNADLWMELRQLCRLHTVRFRKVKGHAGDPFNERCDALATGEIRAHRP